MDIKIGRARAARAQQITATLHGPLCVRIFDTVQGGGIVINCIPKGLGGTRGGGVGLVIKSREGKEKGRQYFIWKKREKGTI